MYLLIDTSNNIVLHKHENNITLAHLAHIEANHCSTALFEETNDKAYMHWSTNGLIQLYENITQQAYNGSKEMLIQWLVKLGPTIPVSPVAAFEAYLQAASINMKNNDVFHYLAGSNKPGVGRKQGFGVSLKGDLQRALTPPIAVTVQAALPPLKQPATVLTTNTQPAKYAPPWA
jgi:hypothetical protein